MPDEDKTKKSHLLVLSIFKGLNFVWREAEPLKCKVRSTAAKNPLTSGTVTVGHGVQDPDFNAQLIWGFTKKEYSALKQEKASVRVECISEKNGIESSIGYFIVKVADALPMEKGLDYGPTHAKTISLLGLKEQWKKFVPKVQVLLHLEIKDENENRQESASSPSTASGAQNQKSSYFAQTQRPKTSQSKSAEEQKKTSMSPARQIQNRPKEFTWHVNEKDGYFELGPKSEGDDLYVLTITIVDGSYFHLLPTAHSQFTESPETFNYAVSYEAFGIPIISDPFTLNTKEESRIAFIGDKTTARIRANSALFHEYLLRTSFETKLLRSHKFTSDEIVSHPSTQTIAVTSFTLRDLGRPGVNEKNFILELLSQHGPDLSTGFTGKLSKPVLRLVASLQASPEFFNEKNLEKIAEPSFSESSVGVSGSTVSSTVLKDVVKENGIENGNGTENGRVKKITFKVPEISKSDSESDSFIRDVMEEVKLHSEFQDVNFQIVEQMKNVVAKNKKEFEKEKAQEKNEKMAKDVQDGHKAQVNGGDKVDESVVLIEEIKAIKTENLDEKNAFRDSGDNANVALLKSPPYKKEKDYSDLEEETISSIRGPYCVDGHDEDFTTSYSSVPSPERLKPDFPPGKYKLSIGLKNVWLKSSKKCFEVPVSITYNHSPFGIINDVSLTAVPNYNRKRELEKNHLFDIVERLHRVVLNVKELTENMVKKQMILEFRYMGEKKQVRFGYALIAIGDLFYKDITNGRRTMMGYADIQKAGSGVGIGQIAYKIHLEEKIEKVSPKKPLENEVENKTREEFNAWKVEEEAAFKKKLEEKGKAYLQLLSEEYIECERERGGILALKIQSCEEKEKKMGEEIKKLAEKEKAYEVLKQNLIQENHNLEMEKMKILESCKMRIIQLSEKRKDDGESHERREKEYLDEVSRLKEKVKKLEEKLKMRDSEIAELHTMRATWPDVNVTLRAEKLELINKELVGKLKDEKMKKEEYKDQLRKMSEELLKAQRERDSQLQAENENLKLQLDANRARDLLAIEHRRVDNFGEELKQFQARLEGTQKKCKRDVNFNQSYEEEKTEHRRSTTKERRKNIKVEEEIGRLTSVREELLKTQAYTPSDLVIKQMDMKIIALLETIQ